MEFVTGSFNLTENGFKKNLETVIHLFFTLDDIEKDDIAFLSDLKKMLQSVFIDENAIIDFNSPVLKDTINNILVSPFFAEIDLQNTKNTDKNCFLLSSENQNLFNQLLEIIGEDITQIDSLSPFYDADASAIFKFAESINKVNLYIPKQRSTFPVDVIKNASETIKDRLNFYIGDIVEDKIPRTIHAKRYKIHTNKMNWDFVTSANLSGAGLTNTTYPRNFEIGILLPTNNSDFPRIETCDFIQDQELHSIKVTEDIQGTPTTTVSEYEPNKNIIKYAYFDGKNILFDIDSSKKPADTKLLATIKVGDHSHESLTFKANEDSGFELKPSMEIDGNQRIVLLLKDQCSEWTSYPFFVSRKKHEPSFLPAMGSSAYTECLRKGGLEGIDLAFQKARESGRDDWLIYLLYHWDLEKILQGLSVVEKSEEGVESTPNTEGHKKTNYSKKRFKNNVDFILQDSNKGLKRLKNYIEQLRDETDKELNIFMRYGLPIYLEITYKFWKKINEQEKSKKEQPHIGFPEYTWLHNVRGYKFFFVFFINDFLNRLGTIKVHEAYDTEETAFLFCAQSWLRKMHTANTLIEFKKDYTAINKLLNKISELKLQLPQDLRISEEVKNRINELLNSYCEFDVLEYL